MLGYYETHPAQKDFICRHWSLLAVPRNAKPLCAPQPWQHPRQSLSLPLSAQHCSALPPLTHTSARALRAQLCCHRGWTLPQGHLVLRSSFGAGLRPEQPSQPHSGCSSQSAHTHTHTLTPPTPKRGHNAPVCAHFCSGDTFTPAFPAVGQSPALSAGGLWDPAPGTWLRGRAWRASPSCCLLCIQGKTNTAGQGTAKAGPQQGPLF